jgi:hypothetical protein
MNRFIQALLSILLVSGSAWAEFEWGADCDSGEGEFAQLIPYRQTITIGQIPRHKRNVTIALDSPVDVDIQLVDQETGTKIIGWPDGILNGPTRAETRYLGVTYVYSGYNGTGSHLGREYIDILGDTNHDLLMQAFGYAAGSATVTYAWEAVPTCNEAGSGHFLQFVPYQATITVGTIPAQKLNIFVELQSSGGQDIDVQLFDDADGTQIVGWPAGLLNGPGPSEIDYGDMTVYYSGYNGIGGNLGHEQIEIIGETSGSLTMMAFGYSAGEATVDYAWGLGAGEPCGGTVQPPLPDCSEGMTCKPLTRTLKVPGECHTANWCLNEKLARIQCAELSHPPGRGNWACETFQCVWVPR